MGKHTFTVCSRAFRPVVRSLALWLALLCSVAIFGQNGGIKGTVTDEEGPVPGANVQVLETGNGTTTSADGVYQLTALPSGNLTITVSYVGYFTVKRQVSLSPGEELQLDVRLVEDMIGLEAVVVSATRSEVPLHDAPVIVNRIDNRIFERTQSLSMAEGLNFSPGLRLETNCQNCGFTQLRMNGLGGPYTQVLINSRPVFSALGGVYGLEMLPANMIDRVEVVRGGGSALYGGNAIAGTVNVITRDPMFNTFQVGTNYASVNGETPDRTVSLNGSVVSDDFNKGLSFYAFHRDRIPWDANGDGFSEMTQLRNTTFGMDAFFKLNDRSKLKINFFNIREFRRGGNRFDLAPHQTDITEQLDHNILGGGIAYETYSRSRRHFISLYASATAIDRDSYYGGGGRVLGPQDTLTASDILAINAYGRSNDLSLVGGFQYTFDISTAWMLTAGTEYQTNDVVDRMPGYNRSIEQVASTLGSYAQLEWKPAKRWSFLMGGRFDYVWIDGDYQFTESSFVNDRALPVLVPRVTAMFNATENLKLRASFAQGYRAPQAFDEDLHIETVGGAARFTALDPELQAERSNSLTVSADYTLRRNNLVSNWVLEGFYTQLANPFITADQRELPNGIAVVTKRNGSGATVAGINLEWNLALSEGLAFQLGASAQHASYDSEEVVWSPETTAEASSDSLVVTRQLLRTPNYYGFATLNWSPLNDFDISLSGVYTGSMLVPHVIDPETEYTALKTTPDFFELNIRVGYAVAISEKFDIHVFAGVQNAFNSFQNDFDTGAERDAGYVYGPSRPRTYFAGLKLHFE